MQHVFVVDQRLPRRIAVGQRLVGTYKVASIIAAVDQPRFIVATGSIYDQTITDPSIIQHRQNGRRFRQILVQEMRKVAYNLDFILNNRRDFDRVARLEQFRLEFVKQAAEGKPMAEMVERLIEWASFTYKSRFIAELDIDRMLRTAFGRYLP